MRLVIKVPAFAADAFLPRGKIGGHHHHRNGQDVRAEQCAKADVADPADGARGIDPDLGRGGGKSHKSSARRNREAPLPAQLFQRVGKMLGTPMCSPDRSKQDRYPDEQAAPHGATSAVNVRLSASSAGALASCTSTIDVTFTKHQQHLLTIALAINSHTIFAIYKNTMHTLL